MLGITDVLAHPARVTAVLAAQRAVEEATTDVGILNGALADLQDTTAWRSSAMVVFQRGAAGWGDLIEQLGGDLAVARDELAGSRGLLADDGRCR